MPRLKTKPNFVNKNKLLWILAGQVYQAPVNSFLNFYTDHKINKNSFIYRTKIINQYPGIIKVVNTEQNIFERNIEILSNQYILENSTIKRLYTSNKKSKSILIFKNKFYFLNLKNSTLSLNSQNNNFFGCCLENDP